MSKIIHKQKGITFVGFVIVMAVIASFVLFILRLFPLYSEKMKIMTVMEYIATQPNAATMNQADVWKLFINNANIQAVSQFPKDQDVRDHVKLEKSEDGSGNVIRVYFDKRSPLFDDIELILDFDQSLPMGGAPG